MSCRIRFDWDELDDNMTALTEELMSDVEHWRYLARQMGLSNNDYLALELTHVAQNTLDYAYKTKVDWAFLYRVLRNRLNCFTKASWRSLALDCEKSVPEVVACDCFKYVAHAVDFKDYLHYSLEGKVAVSEE